MAEAIAQSGVPQDFEGWVARPMPLNVEKCGERAAFWDNFCGAPSVVERANCDNKEDGCVVYGREPMGVDKAFRITLEGTTDRKWQRGLTVGLATIVPERVPSELPHINTKHGFHYEIRYMDENNDSRSRANTLARNLPLLWHTGITKSLCLYLSTAGDLHIYFDGQYIKKLESGLPLDKDLRPVVDVSGRCARIKCEILSRPEPAKKNTPEYPSSSDSALPPLTCFKAKPVRVEVPRTPQTATLAPRGLGVAAKVPPGAIEQDGAPPTFAFTTCSPQNFVHPSGYKIICPVYYIAANKPLEEEVEFLVEHSADVKTSEQAEEMVFFVASPPADGSKEVKFTLLPGKFEVGEEHGSVRTSHLGFLNAGIKESAATKMKSRYAVMCSFTNEEQAVRHVAISISLVDSVYMTNFRDALQEEWKASMSHTSRVPVSYVKSTACVIVPPNEQGWEVIPDTWDCNFPREVVDFDDRDCLTKVDYPPRFKFIVKTTTRSPEPCVLQFSVAGLTTEVSFQISLDPTKSINSHTKDAHRPDLMNLRKMGDIKIIEETAPHCRRIGTILLQDRRGNRLDSIEIDNPKTEGRMWKVYQIWLEEDEFYSWETLCHCLRQCDLNNLAHRIEELVGLAPLSISGSRFRMSGTPTSPLGWLAERVFNS